MQEVFITHYGTLKADIVLYNGYVDMPFEDPEGYESDSQDIAVGKEL